MKKVIVLLVVTAIGHSFSYAAAEETKVNFPAFSEQDTGDVYEKRLNDQWAIVNKSLNDYGEIKGEQAFGNYRADLILQLMNLSTSYFEAWQFSMYSPKVFREISDHPEARKKVSDELQVRREQISSLVDEMLRENKTSFSFLKSKDILGAQLTKLTEISKKSVDDALGLASIYREVSSASNAGDRKSFVGH